MLVSYPRTGRKTLPIGETIIDITSQQVFLADSTEEVLESAEMIRVARSMLIYVDTSLDLKLYRKGALVHDSTRFPTWGRFDVVFDRMEITTTKHTSFYMQISDFEDGVPRISQPDYYEGNPYISNTEVAVAGSPNTEEVYDTLDRNARKGTLRHNSEKGILYIEHSHNGTDYTDQIPLNPGDAIEYDGDDIHTIKVDTDRDGTAYVLVLNPGV
ncbi:hypothetical protein KAR91_06500 [Candidatus Pacearchaeota archaeon]|nr:hypothetical protein [Candidatus Pacearchaeota archaeon]